MSGLRILSVDRDEAENEARLRQQTDHVEKNVIEVEGNTMGLGVGHLVTLLPDLDGGVELFPFASFVAAS